MPETQIPQRNIDTVVDLTPPPLPPGAHDKEVIFPFPTEQLTKLAGPALRGAGEGIPDLSGAPNTAMQKEGVPIISPHR